MASKAQVSIAFLLFLNLVFFSMVSSHCTGNEYFHYEAKKCPTAGIDLDELLACNSDLLNADLLRNSLPGTDLSNTDLLNNLELLNSLLQGNDLSNMDLLKGHKGIKDLYLNYAFKKTRCCKVIEDLTPVGIKVPACLCKTLKDITSGLLSRIDLAEDTVLETLFGKCGAGHVYGLICPE
ncbi:Hydrophobic seed protein [Parasponia andersonii]|uniref:Hydrophobic seed protein n=1 Tax=Parasponia andersonii TaxID=3476 RepID=A0A2P5AVQ5_PARAD|nr:Hydrophobic seed protein [Parasponia andersonii]